MSYEHFLYNGSESAEDVYGMDDDGYVEDGCDWVGSVTIAPTVSFIGDEAFANCKNLSSIEIPAKVRRFGFSVFENCTNLEEVTLPPSIKAMGTHVFSGCSNLKRVNILSQITNIPKFTFGNCSNLQSVTMSNTITSIHNEAFNKCPNLDSETRQRIKDINAGRPHQSGISKEMEKRELEKKGKKGSKKKSNKEPEKKGKKDNSQFESSFQQLNVSKGWDLFISHSTKDDSHDVYIAVSNYMKAKDLNIFNPTVHLTHYDEINVQAMQDAVAKSKFVIAALSDGFFESEWCKKEIEAARDNGIKVIPVYSGDDYGNKQIDKWVKTFTKDSSFKYIFKENARDVLNKQNTGSTYKTLKHLAELAKKN